MDVPSSIYEEAVRIHRIRLILMECCILDYMEEDDFNSLVLTII
ncbi:hypothetical protein LCGC14_3151060 [marine sediment metagenome]|uniref:Uncharacterized protein n=1 Tax=marine sediment metagenome TaxID=412755 RepID=A0A0F8YIH7_9ZZZZ